MIVRGDFFPGYPLARHCSAERWYNQRKTDAKGRKSDLGNTEGAREKVSSRNQLREHKGKQNHENKERAKNEKNEIFGTRGNRSAMKSKSVESAEKVNREISRKRSEKGEIQGTAETEEKSET